LKTDIAQNLDQVLESAVILSWTDLMKDAASGLLHLEYAFAPDSSLDCLKLWSARVRGHWHLVCEYRMSASTGHCEGLHFESEFRSAGLAQSLEFIMRHQRSFSPSPNFGRTGLLQVQPPTDAETTEAANLLREAYRRVNTFSAEPPLAWAAVGTQDSSTEEGTE